MPRQSKVSPNTPEDVVALLTERQAGVQVTQELLNDFQMLIDREGELDTNAHRMDQLGRIADLTMALTQSLQPPMEEADEAQIAEANEKVKAYKSSPKVTVGKPEAPEVSEQAVAE